MSWRHFVPPAFVAGVGGLTLLGMVIAPAASAARALFGLYAAAVLAVAAMASLRRGVRAWLATALAFASIHCAWGAGFLRGLIVFAGRWRIPENAPPRLDEPGDAETAVSDLAGASVGSHAGGTA